MHLGYRDKRHVLFTIYSDEALPRIRQQLTDASFVFTERQVFNNFWGVEFSVERPTGRGALARLKFLENL